MALHAELSINGYTLGEGVFVTRLTPPDPNYDTVCTYRVEVYRHRLPVHTFNLEHRFGDGAMVLMAKAFEQWRIEWQHRHAEDYDVLEEDDTL